MPFPQKGCERRLLLSSLPLVSVIIPVYNAQSTIELAINSVLKQTYPALEIIAVDDGSTDQTPVLLDRIAKETSRLKVITQRNAGVSAARNAALSQCHGKYIRFVDADDTLPEQALEIMVSRIEKDQTELAIGGYTEYLDRISRSKNLLNCDAVYPFHQLTPVLCRHANSYYFGVLWNKLFLADIIRREKLRFDPAVWWGEDFAFVMDYLRFSERITLMKDSVYDYRRSPTSTTFRQVTDCIVHPLGNIKMKISLYRHLKGLYVYRGIYDDYKHNLWHYLFRVGLN